MSRVPVDIMMTGDEVKYFKEHLDYPSFIGQLQERQSPYELSVRATVESRDDDHHLDLSTQRNPFVDGEFWHLWYRRTQKHLTLENVTTARINAEFVLRIDDGWAHLLGQEAYAARLIGQGYASPYDAVTDSYPPEVLFQH